MPKRKKKQKKNVPKEPVSQEEAPALQPQGNAAFLLDNLPVAPQTEPTLGEDTTDVQSLLTAPGEEGDGNSDMENLWARLAELQSSEAGPQASPQASPSSPQDIATLLGVDMEFRKSENSIYEQLSGCREEITGLQEGNADFTSIPTENLMAIQGYSKAGYDPINFALGHPEAEGSTEDLETYKWYIEGIKAGLDQLPPYTGRVYRGANESKIGHPLEAYQIGATLTEPAFMSTTKSYSVFLEFKDTVNFVIESKTGRLIEEIAHDSTEEEVLLKPRTTFTITDRQEDGGVVTIWMTEK